MAEIFISYSSNDIDKVRRLVSEPLVFKKNCGYAKYFVLI